MEQTPLLMDITPSNSCYSYFNIDILEYGDREMTPENITVGPEENCYPTPSRSCSL